ncbi:FAD-dependent oxidoreductase [Mycobacterium sp. Aquia_213]|uniref:FAD-dependent oxidoreductase n=1 Tax=Mycobacterium sp. Aquia_213 TaxID=2991728 RepID=UPI00226ECECE|nr:FAD-dependent oxidoreductase [Mycobacterium sp. Aquia_213]WAC94143.1 FAD-dependent monooxygenase [Mycobacterium sp. Aquia_213]
MRTIEVAVIGAGPTGLMLACELAMRGIRVEVFEKRTDLPNITRAFAVHARTLELLDARGLADDEFSRGFQVSAVAPAPGVTLSLAKDLRTRYPTLLIVAQSGTEQLLTARAEQLGVTFVRGAEVVELRQDRDGVVIGLANDDSVRAGYVVGCDGAHSAVRRALGVPFAGKQYQTHILLADVQLTRPPDDRLFARTNNQGLVLVIPFGDGWYRVTAWDRQREQAPLTEPVTMTEIRDAFDRIAGDDYGLSEMRWSSRFLSERRQAEHYRVGRVFLAGDAAHIHSPIGGQGMNTGIGDAMNLGWKLAAAVRGSASDWLLDSYESERHPVGASVLALTDTLNQLVLGQSAARRVLQRLAMRALTHFSYGRRRLAERLSGIGIAYPRRRADNRLVGRRMPDVDCGGTRLYEVLRSGRFVLVTSAQIPGLDRPGVDHVVHVDPKLPAAMLIRPDGYIAWATRGTPDATQVSAVLDRWCGLQASIACTSS